MTDSVLEKLLKQMPLKEASTELDDRVAAVLNARHVVSAGDGSRGRSWAMMTAVAVACLVVGAGVGLAVGRVSAVSRDDSRQVDLTPVDKRKGQDQSDESTEPVVVVDGQFDLSDFAAVDQFRGPQVAMLCALNGHWTPDAHEARCLSCHHGITAAQARFREEHVRLPQFQACMFCHDTTAAGEIIR